jgi:hypothetical protein
MSFVQTISFRSYHEEQVKKLLVDWEAAEKGRSPGYQRSWLLKDRDRESTYLLSVEFSSYEDAMRNSERSETGAWADKLRHAVEGELGYRNYDIVWGE